MQTTTRQKILSLAVRLGRHERLHENWILWPSWASPPAGQEHLLARAAEIRRRAEHILTGDLPMPAWLQAEEETAGRPAGSAANPAAEAESETAADERLGAEAAGQPGSSRRDSPGRRGILRRKPARCSPLPAARRLGPARPLHPAPPARPPPLPAVWRTPRRGGTAMPRVPAGG